MNKNVVSRTVSLTTSSIQCFSYPLINTASLPLSNSLCLSLSHSLFLSLSLSLPLFLTLSFSVSNSLFLWLSLSLSLPLSHTLSSSVSHSLFLSLSLSLPLSLTLSSSVSHSLSLIQSLTVCSLQSLRSTHAHPDTKRSSSRSLKSERHGSGSTLSTPLLTAAACRPNLPAVQWLTINFKYFDLFLSVTNTFSPPFIKGTVLNKFFVSLEKERGWEVLLRLAYVLSRGAARYSEAAVKYSDRFATPAFSSIHSKF